MVELCFNLWYFVTADQTLEALAARLYLLDGSDEEKASVLSGLSNHDFRLATKQPIPVAVQDYYGGVVPYSAIQQLGVEEVYREVFAELAATVPPEMEFPEEKVFFATPLFDFGEGYVPAMIGDGFIKNR